MTEEERNTKKKRAIPKWVSIDRLSIDYYYVKLALKMHVCYTCVNVLAKKKNETAQQRTLTAALVWKWCTFYQRLLKKKLQKTEKGTITKFTFISLSHWCVMSAQKERKKWSDTSQALVCPLLRRKNAFFFLFWPWSERKKTNNYQWILSFFQ